jgi:carboxymethylenebutenolidase
MKGGEATGKSVSFAADGGTTTGYLAEPSSADPAKGVIVIQEWWGLNDHIKDVADRFAAAGFTALAPDLYHGKVTKSPDEAGKLLMALSIDQAEKDLRGAVSYLRKMTGKPVGVVGFCMGGALSLFAACANDGDIGACVVYYGGHPKVEFEFDALTAPVLGHWAERDDFANPNAAKIEAALRHRGKSYEGHVYAGTRHAFFNDRRPEVYDEAAAKQSWERTVAFFDANL